MESFRIQSGPDSMYYIPNFISEEEETYLLNKIPVNRWVSLSHRRLQAVPSRLTAGNTLLAAPLPVWLTTPIVKRFDEVKLFDGAPHGVNHCLINEYLPGQGIMAHEDGGAYHPIVATVSLGGTVILDITSKSTTMAHNNETAHQQTWRILQEPRSLLVTTGAAYTDTLHGIAEVTRDTGLNAESVSNWRLLGDSEKFIANKGINERTTRISLTFRDVKKVSSIGNKLFGKGRT